MILGAQSLSSKEIPTSRLALALHHPSTTLFIVPPLFNKHVVLLFIYLSLIFSLTLNFDDVLFIR